MLRLSVQQEESKEEDKEEDGVKWHRVERSAAFSGRSLRLPEAADTAAIKASYKDGVLSLDIPKKQQSKAETSRITVE